MKGQPVIHCIQCGSNKVKSNDLAPLWFVGVLATVWIPILGWILAVIFLAAGISSLMKKGKRFTCMECKHTFRVSKEKFLEYKNSLKGEVS